MTFNALISNTDDHPRNDAVIALDQDSGCRRFTISCRFRSSAWSATISLSPLVIWGATQARRFLLEREAVAPVIDDMEKPGARAVVSGCAPRRRE